MNKEEEAAKLRRMFDEMVQQMAVCRDKGLNADVCASRVFAYGSNWKPVLTISETKLY